MEPEPIQFETDPGRYRHFKLSADGPIAILTLAVPVVVAPIFCDRRALGLIVLHDALHIVALCGFLVLGEKVNLLHRAVYLGSTVGEKSVGLVVVTRGPYG